MVQAGSSPPLFISLHPIFSDLSNSIGQFRLYDTSQVIYSIAGQLTWVPNVNGHNLGAALSQYLDSIPGLIMFIVIVVGLALTMIFFARFFVKETSVGSGNKIFPCLTATIVAALFFILLSALQVPLAFTADVDASTILFGTLATLLFTLPVLFIDYTPKQTATTSQITDKVNEVLNKLQTFENQINNVKENTPVNVSSPEGKMLIIKDSLEDILRKSKFETYETQDLNMKFAELDKIGKDIDTLESELNTILSEYQIFINCEFSDWVGKLKGIGLDVKTTVNPDFQKEMPLQERVDAIKQILEAGRALARDVIKIAEPIYGIIRPLYDPTLPEQSRAIEFTMQKLEQKDSPWIAIEALFNALNNWKRQYGGEILNSVKYLENSITPIADLSSEGDVLPPIFGENLPKVLDYAKKAESMKSLAEKKIQRDQLNMVDVIALKDDIQAFLDIAKDVLSMLYTELVSEEDAIELLLPTKDYLWEKNSTLRERLKKVTETLSNPSNYKINQIMENLPTYISYVDESVKTLAVYNERREFLLNYPTAEAAIKEQLKEKNQLSPQDLPFQEKFAGEYLRLYYAQRFSKFSFDKENFVLTKKAVKSK